MLHILAEYRVDFIVIGGLAAILQGAPLVTLDLDVVHSRAEDNLPRLLAAVEELDAIYREQPQRRIRPELSHLASPGHQLLTTRFGPLDLLGTVGTELTYTDLLPNSAEWQIDTGLSVRLLDLSVIIQLKQEAGRPKDLAALPVLRQTLAERKHTQGK